LSRGVQERGKGKDDFTIPGSTFCPEEEVKNCIQLIKETHRKAYSILDRNLLTDIVM
jgi:hypothetical protein